MTDEMKKTCGALEAVLFTMGQAVSTDTLTMALDCNRETVEEAIEELKKEYEDSCRGLRILKLEDSYQLCAKPEHYEALVKIATQPIKPILTEVMLEVLSIIAYRQPVTRNEIEKIRGVSSDYTVNRLIEFGLIEEAGRLDAPGRPILFKTTEEFQIGNGFIPAFRHIGEMNFHTCKSHIQISMRFTLHGTDKPQIRSIQRFQRKILRSNTDCIPLIMDT